MDTINHLFQGALGLLVVLAMGSICLMPVYYSLWRSSDMTRMIITGLSGLALSIGAMSALYDTTTETIEVQQVFDNGDIVIVQATDGNQYLYDDTLRDTPGVGETYELNVSREFAGVVGADQMIQSYEKQRDAVGESVMDSSYSNGFSYNPPSNYTYDDGPYTLQQETGMSNKPLPDSPNVN